MVHREVKCTSAAVMKFMHAGVDLVELYYVSLTGWVTKVTFN